MFWFLQIKEASSSCDVSSVLCRRRLRCRRLSDNIIGGRCQLLLLLLFLLSNTHSRPLCCLWLDLFLLHVIHGWGFLVFGSTNASLLGLISFSVPGFGRAGFDWSYQIVSMKLRKTHLFRIAIRSYFYFRIFQYTIFKITLVPIPPFVTNIDQTLPNTTRS